MKIFRSINQSPRRMIIAGLAFLLLSSFALASNWENVSAFAQQIGAGLTGQPATPSGAQVSRTDQKSDSSIKSDQLTIGTCDLGGASAIEVEANATTTGYPSLNAAFTAINAGTHTGSIAIDVCGNTTETASAILNSGAVAPASYTDVTIRPVGGARIIEGSIVGAIIKLNGADNVTIDGRQGGTGTARDLTVRNNNTSTATAAIWLASVAAGNGASGNTVRNLEIAAGVDQSTASTNVTFGIAMCGTTISATANGVDNDNNSFIANRIVKARYGIMTRGTTTDLSINPVITDNIIGPNAFGTDQIGKVGILLQADTGATVSRNTVQFVGCLDPQACGGADRMGIAIGNESWSMAPGTITSNTYTVTKNVVHDVIEELTFSSMGINLATTGGGTATNNLVANNFIYNVRANGTSGDQAVGLGIAGGHTDRVVFNSIAMTGDVDPGASTASSNFGSGIRIANTNGTTHLNLTLQNNSVYMDLSSSSGPTVRFYAISGNSAAYAFGTGGENYNNYYINPSNTQLQTGGLGTAAGAALTTQFATLANWQAAYTVPQDANSIQANPAYTSPTSDLHLTGASPNINAGLTIAGIADDIDAEVRPNGPNPDIGADEFYPAPGVLQLNSATYAGNEGGTVNATVNRVSGSSGTVGVTYTLTDGTATGGAACGAGVDYVNPGPQVLTFADLVTSQPINVTLCTDLIADPAEAFTITLSNPTGGATLGSPAAATVTITDVPPPFNGTFNVGTGQTYTSLSNPGGIFEAINLAGATGNIVINISSDLTGETGAVALNEIAGGFTVTIKPTGAARTITGSSTTAIIRLNDADNVTIDGSLTGGTATGIGGDPALRNLTVQNTSTTATAGAVIAVGSNVNGAQNNTIKNVNIVGQDPTQTLIGIHMGAGAPGSAGLDNDNNRIENCSFQKSFIGIYNTGASVANPNTGNVITMNDLSATGANRLRRAGIFFFNQNGIQVTLNSIGGIAADESADAIGIIAGIQNVTTTSTTSGGVTNANISRNRISGVASVSTVGFSAVGIAIAGDPAGPNTISNNMISGVIAPSTSPDFVAGIFVAGVTGSDTRVYFNSISMTGNRGAVASQIGSYGVAISGTNPIVELKNNIFYNTQISGGGAAARSYAIGMTSTTFGNLNSDYNDFLTSGANAAGFRTGSLDTTGTDLANLAAWQTAVSDDANSKEVDPLFVDPATDLHLQATSTLINMGTAAGGITVDYDGQTRDATPDIGADEFTPPNTAPTITAAAGVTRQEGSPSSNSTIANVTDTESGNGAVVVTVTSANPSNGVTISNIVNTGGVVTADIIAACGATNASFTLQASDGSLTATDTLNVTVTPNTAPTLTYANATVASGGATTVNPATGPTDNGSVASIVVQSAGTYTGTISVNNVTGVVSISNAAPVGIHTITIRATDNCGAFTDTTFMLDVTGGPTGPVTVTATAGTPGPTNYPTLKDAIDAINAGTHQGDITVSIVTSTTETTSIVLNSSGAGSALYTSVLIRPVSDGVTVAGPTAQGRGLIELNGADNVTIDGDNPNTAGTNRNLTLQNTAVSTTTFTSVVRIALAATIVNSADNDTIRNLNILGSATGRNIATAISTVGSENTTFGIFAGPGGSTVSATTPPAAVASVVTSVGAGATANNLLVSNNSIATTSRGVSMNGSATTVFPGLQITGNRIGNPTAGDPDQVYAIGVTAQGSANAVISGNTIWVEGFIPASASTHGINVGVNSAVITGATIENNMVNRVRNNNIQTWSAYGINLGGGNNHIVQNNFVSGVINNQTGGTGAFGTTFGAYGIRAGAGTGHKVYHNSVHLYGAIPGATSTNLTASFMIVATTQTGMDVRNNIFSNQITGGNPTGTRNVAVFLPSGATAAMNLTDNNNAYFVGTDVNNRLAQVGITFGTGEFLTANFDPTATTPATNFRSYTSTLSAAGTNDNASFATSNPPPFTSNVNLHIPAGTATRLESGGAAVGVTLDIDAETRNATTPDIGADEFAGMPPFANDMQASNFITPANGATLQVGQTFSPQASFANNGTVTQTNVTVRYRITDPSSVVIYNQTAVIPSIAPLQIAVATFPSTSLPAPGVYTIQASVELAGDQDPTNDSISGSVTAVLPISGTINVGTGETFTSLTNPGGVFQALNTAGISGNVTVNITSDLTGETGVVPLNQLTEAGVGGYTVTFKPSGAARTVSGNAASLSMIKLNGADRIVFDGSLSGGTDRSLSLIYTNTGGTVVWIAAANASNGANNNTFKNCIIASNPGTVSVAGVLGGSGVTLGGPAEAQNNNNTITNNSIFRVQNSMYNQGATTFDQNWTVTNNTFGSTVAADKNSFRGMLMGNAQNFVISGNTVNGVSSTTTTTAAMSGIQLAFTVSNGQVVNNKISDIKNNSASGTGAFGMQISATSAAANVTIANNFISDVTALGSATIVNNGHGMNFNGAGAGGYKVYHNSINMNTNQASGTTSAFNVTTAVTAAGAIDLRNNILANTQTSGATRYAVFSAAPASVFNPINYNDYFAPNVGFIGGAARVTLADWQTATGQDANSQAVDPLFVSTNDLHIQPLSPMVNTGVAGTGITTDIDNQTRDAMPDIGADEIIAPPMPGTLQFSSATYSGGEAGSPFTVTVTRTNGSAGTVTVNYATSNGTATGGASCTPGIDYVTTSGTLTFADGVTSQTFNVVICNDNLDESDETINYTLSNPTGGATIGTPGTAVQTIVDDDAPAGTLSVNDVRIKEGNSGSFSAVFTVTYTGAAVPVSVQYATSNGTAIAGTDYFAVSGTLNFNSLSVTTESGIPTQTQTVTVPLISETVKEANETFFLNLSNPTNAAITDGQGVGIIIDDDRAYVSDFDRDLTSDVSVFRPSEGLWYVLQTASGTPKIVPLGSSGDRPVPGDYDGDGLTDYALWRPSSGTWYVLRSSDAATQIISWGLSGDKPVQGDYDGDGKTDIAVYRPSTGTWWVIRSSNGSTFAVNFGISTDRPVQGDYDGDARTDIAVYRDGVWYILQSSNASVQIQSFGLATDRPVSGDFDGDGKYDLAVFRDGDWWIAYSLTGTVFSTPYGLPGDIPAPADYDGDGTSDIAVFRPSGGDWYLRRSSDTVSVTLHWGSNGDIPVPSAYLPQ